MQRLCPRCRYAVTVEHAGSLSFCSNCGAAQVRLSGEILGEIQRRREAYETGESGPPGEGAVPAERESGAVDWRGAIHCAALAGLVALALGLLSIPLAAVSLLALFWAIAAPVVTLGLYSARFSSTRIQPRFGAQLGLLCGLAVVLATGILNTADLLLTRFVFHAPGAIDGAVDKIFAQARTAALQQSGPAAAPMLGFVDVPEFRAGMILFMLGCGIVFYLAFSVAGGTFAGFLRARQPRR